MSLSADTPPTGNRPATDTPHRQRTLRKRQRTLRQRTLDEVATSRRRVLLQELLVTAQLPCVQGPLVTAQLPVSMAAGPADVAAPSVAS